MNTGVGRDRPSCGKAALGFGGINTTEGGGCLRRG